MALLRLPVGTVAATLVVAAATAAPAGGQTLTQDEALRLAFGSAATVKRRTAYLDPAQLGEARALAGSSVDVEQTIVTYYVATEAGAPLGVAYFDAHRVRTLPEVLMVVVDPEGRVDRVETVSFREPPDYRAPDGWLAQLLDRRLDDDLSVRGDIANLTGATLTANAATRAVRRVLALHAVIDPFGTDGP